jgi:uncharacterized protein
MIFIDTSAWYARMNERDEHHPDAVAAWPALARQPVCTSNAVLYESFELIGRHAGGVLAAEVARRILHTPGLTVLRATAADELAAVELLASLRARRSAGRRPVGFRDCLSFTLMKAHRVTRAFSFDGHFDEAGFERWPLRR